jgi:hypothetical protein
MGAGAADDNADGEVSRSNRVLEVRYVHIEERMALRVTGRHGGRR